MWAGNIALLWSARNHVLKFGLIGLFACISLDPAIPSTTQTLTAGAQKSEVIAPGVEHTQITRGFKSEKESTGPWLINMLRIDLSKARLRLVHAMDEAVGLETVSSMAARHGALAAVNSGYFRTTGTYRGDSVGVEVLNGKLLSEPNSVRAALGLIEKSGRQELIFGHIKFEGQITSGLGAKWHGRPARGHTRKMRGPR